MRLDRGIPFQVGCIDSTIYGGSYKFYEPNTRRLVGVKMAAEIKAPCDIDIPTVDYSVPDPVVLRNGIARAFVYMAQGKDVYVGCMGGVGRTGLFMAVAMKARFAYEGYDLQLVNQGDRVLVEGLDPVMFVRQYYSSHAVETSEQEQYVDEFDVSGLVAVLRDLNTPWLPHEPVYVWPTWWQCVKRVCGFSFDKRKDT